MLIFLLVSEDEKVPGSLSRRGPAWFAKGSSAALSDFLVGHYKRLNDWPSGRPGGARTRTPSATQARSRGTCTGSLTRRNATIHGPDIRFPLHSGHGRGKLSIKPSLLNVGLSGPTTISHALPGPGTLLPRTFIAHCSFRFASGSTSFGPTAGGCLPFCITGRKSNPSLSRSRRDPRARPAP